MPFELICFLAEPIFGGHDSATMKISEREMYHRMSLIFQLIPATFADLYQFGGAFQFLLDHVTATDLCLVFAIELDC
ncbi:rCG63386 [Rattus norvegicus]|uniref:RCG63386 n=1 Tax=Rattus norvegicus TaxID=10116 RepID=A6IJQ0_RAT|nr:rCG63386 [Rattus norvegicus]